MTCALRRASATEIQHLRDDPAQLPDFLDPENGSAPGVEVVRVPGLLGLVLRLFPITISQVKPHPGWATAAETELGDASRAEIGQEIDLDKAWHGLHYLFTGTAWEGELLLLASQRLQAIRGVRLVGTAPEKIAVLSFILEGVHPHDVGTVLDDEGVAVRAGHHCAQPVMARFGIPATVRASFAFYNTSEEIEALARGVERAEAVFR